MTDDEKRIWRELVRGLAPGVGRSSDRWAMETMVRLKVKERANTITSSERAQLILLMGRFGMTPADRAKISVEAPKESVLQRFLQRRNITPAAATGPIQ